MKTKTNGIETNYELHGKEGAPWLVLSHSLACSVRMWDPQIEALKGEYRILAYDTRGHGGSEAPKGAYTLEMLADDLKALLDALGVRNPHYCGLSMGGMIGQTFALKYPGVFRTLVLADTSSRIPPEAGPLWQQRIGIAEGQGMVPLVQPTLERWFTEPFRKSHPEPVEEIGNLIASTPVAGYIGCCHAIPKLDLTARLREIKTPILVICGDKDAGTPPAMSEAIRDNAPGARLEMIADASHLSNLEQPAAFTKAMRDFLAAH
jgi:3-oxoadipate enol-lactonase